MSESLDVLPEGWTEVEIGKQFECWGGSTPATTEPRYWGGDIPWLSSKDIKEPTVARGTEYITEAAVREKGLRKVQPGSVVVVMRSGILAHTFPVAVTQADITINQDLKAFDSGSTELNEWLALALRADEQTILSENRRDGTTVQSIQLPLLKSHVIRIPPPDERRRIRQRIEELLQRVDIARDRLSVIPGILARFRQAVLAAACSGRLTKDWRQSIHAEPYNLKQQANVRTAEPPAAGFGDDDLPDDWGVASLDAITTRITSGSRDWTKYYGRGTGTFIMAQNVRPGFFDTSYRQAVDPPADNRDRQRSQIERGDLLITIVGANTGDVCPVLRDYPEHYVCQSVALMRPLTAELTPFLSLYLNSPEHGQAYFGECNYGAGRPHLSFDQLKATPVIIPPIEEQQEIVRRVDALLAVADSVEARLKLAADRVEATTQAILAKAFRGELVPTDVELARALS